MIQEEADLILCILAEDYPVHNGVVSFLVFENPFQILILTILSAQTTDRTVNSISGALFRNYPDACTLADASPEDVESIIRPTGFYHTKAKNIISTARALAAHYDGEVPQTMSDLVTLPGVGRKTANIVLNHAFGQNVGIAVDTHVRRLSQRIGFSDATAPETIEKDLMHLFEKSRWKYINYLLISHGRAVCNAKKPNCSACKISGHCRFFRENSGD
ncbi:endonuclease III [Methanogenium sp. MK-MG]|uniref:endonuclease III n=1 Tax=Methanogenium sp. MK-MG TaxID=2599926 RepID=UPI0013ED26BB|nr:endonuclease III [Methanogenium sp. MK-MG]KAF1074677.1 G/T mismatches repair enzyme [Methanogenium sp. MK-MG]